MRFLAIGRWLLVAALLPAALALLGPAVVHDPAAFNWARETSSKFAGPFSDWLAAKAHAATVAGALTTLSPATRAESEELLAFSRRVANGRPDSVSGLYVAGILALRVVQQPADNPGFISGEEGTATQFQRADQFGAIGLLAHNTLAGRDFLRISPAEELVLIYGDGRAEHFRVSQIVDYERLTRADLRSDFLALDTNGRYTADQVFARFYQHAHRLTLQTCLARGDIADWGVRFVVAEPSQPPR